MSNILTILDYSLAYKTASGMIQALDGINLAIERGEVLGLVGESGSGKSSLAWAIMRYLPKSIRESGTIALADKNLNTASAREIEHIRGRRIGMVFQDPSTSLNPTLSLGEQLAEVLAKQRGLTRRQAWAAGEAALDRVGIKQPAAIMKRYPHETSGGEKQRLVIAAAFASQPECLLFDEPTTALDVITAGKILDLFAELQAETGVASLYISHDLALVARVANRVAVLHHGRVVEQGRGEAIFSAPRHAYTRRLLAAVPRPDHRLVEPYRDTTAAPLMAVEHVTVCYERASLLARLARRRSTSVSGNRDINITVRPAEIFGIIGESGSGKSSLAKALTGLVPFSGTIRFDNRSLSGAGAMDRAYRRDVQIIFQHPDSSLNPRQTIGEILSRPLKLYRLAELLELRARIVALLEQVRLPAHYIDHYPHQLSGGEKQRVAIARAFASQPRLVICDEITAALDVSVQASVIALLIDLQRRFGTAYLFITHDLNLVRQIAHRIAILYRGELVELLDCDAVPEVRHPYTQALIKAVPAPISPAMI